MATWLHRPGKAYAESNAEGSSWATFWGDDAKAAVGLPTGAGTPMQVVMARTEGQVFRERVGFVVLCIIGAYCSMRILVELRYILEPFLWALFLVMAWKPVVDGIELRLELMLAVAFPGLGKSDLPKAVRFPCTKGHDSEDELDGLDGELDSMIERGSERSESSPMLPEVLPDDARDKRGTRESCQDVDEEDWEVSTTDGGRPSFRRALARSLAVLMASMGMLALLSVFGLLIMESARHMQEHWDVYQKGADQLTRDLLSLFSKVPESFKKQYQEVSADTLKSAQDLFYSLLGNIVNNVSSLILGVLLTMLYTLFWLCSPVPMDSSVDVMFRKYIMFKTLACFGYGISAGLLLYFLSVDLASVFALTTFALNFVPEVGPFIAMVLPCPVIILDSRIDRPMLVLFVAILGQLALKFAFSNIIEVKLIESDKKLRMHPVMILLSVGVFGYLWGPTGMLLSVPLMALMKIALFSELVPSSYRDPILVILEGDRNAPRKHGLKGSSKRASARRAAPGG